MTKKDKSPSGTGKKGKGKEIAPEPAEDEQFISSVDLDIPEREPDQYTETSYTSASFESLPPVEEYTKKNKKKRKKAEDTEEIEDRTTDDLEIWSDEDFFEEKEPEIVEEEEEPKKKKKKGGKKKKEKAEKEPIPEFKKPKNWKSLSPKQRREWLEMMTQEYLAEKEAEKQAYIAGAKGRREAFERMLVDTKEKDVEEQAIRSETLAVAVLKFQEFEQKKLDHEYLKQLKAAWKQYLKCDGLPDPRVVTQVNTYLHVWKSTGDCDPDALERRCVEVLPMIRLLEELVSTKSRFTQRQVDNFNEIRTGLREQLSEAMECCMYMLLRDVERKLKRESLQVAKYGRDFKAVCLHAWVAVRMPIKMKLENEPEPEPLELDFPELRLNVRLPRGLDTSTVCVRAARENIDLLSERTRTFRPNREMPEEFGWDLYTFTVNEHDAVYKMAADQAAVRQKFHNGIKARVKELEAFVEANKFLKNKEELEELERLAVAEPPEMPDPRIFCGEQRAGTFASYVAACAYRLRPGEVDLRKHRICAGVLRLDLLEQPPQPKLMAAEREVTVLSRTSLQHMRYKVLYQPPAAPAAGVTRTPEEIEAEMKQVELEYEKLARVHIDLSPDVMWFEPPLVCQWNSDRLLWTSLYINDVKYNEDKYTIQFRTGVLWPIGLATLKYSNMPYQGWDMRPDPKRKGVLLTVSGLNVSITWSVRSRTVSIELIHHAATQALQEHKKKPYSIKQMIEIMREGACDFFPDMDAHNYVEGSCQKEWVLEQHQYHAMACLSQGYQFQWSRWNAAAGFRNIVMQVREAVDKKRQASFSTMLATPLKCTIIQCSELSQEYSDELAKGMRFFPDLMSMNAQYGSVDARRASRNISPKLTETVFQFLKQIKPCSFS